MFSKIDVVLKITERCNINCTYCYMFNKDSSLSMSKPKQMSLTVAHDVATFLRQGAIETGATVVRFICHGGEPLMMPPSRFESLCQTLVSVIGDVAVVEFSIQTNAMLIDERWLALFEKYKFGIGVSLDGDREANDRYRVDHQGHGTYERTLAGTRTLLARSETGRIQRPALLCVIDPDQDGAAVFNHFVKEIGFRWLDFLLPIETRDSIRKGDGLRIGIYLEGVMDAWQRHGDERVVVRFFDNFYSFMTGYQRASMRPLRANNGTLIVTVASDGTFGPDDTLRIVDSEYFSFDCRSTSLAEYLKDPRIKEVNAAIAAPSSECVSCAWTGYCVGGSTNGRVINRYEAGHAYQRKSALCDGLKHIYGRLASTLVANGYPRDAMFERLDRAAERAFGLGDAQS